MRINKIMGGISQGIADTHTHTMYSGFSEYSYLSYPDCITTPKRSVKVAEKIGLDVLCITDHNSIKGAIEAKKFNRELVVVGEEIRSRDGEIIGLFLQENVEPDLSAEETVERIHEQDGIAIAPHPFSAICSGLGQKIHSVGLDGVEVFNSLHRDGYSNAIALKRSNGNAMLGGSDAHASIMIGNGYTLFEGTSQEELRTAIKRKKTTYGGTITPLPVFIKYSIRLAIESSKLILKYNGVNCPMSDRVTSVRNSYKMLYLFGSFVFAFSPLPMASALLGERILRYKGRRVWNESLEMSLTPVISGMQSLI
jgi:predicted metal-dependent phosphoesterase TrpH